MARILVIDDDAEMRQMIEQTLTAAGYEVTLAADGEQGMRLYRTRPADLVITDIFMPNQEGLETIMALHREFPAVSIIAITGKPGVAIPVLSMAEQLGATRTLEKPFLPADLLSAVAEVLESRS